MSSSLPSKCLPDTVRLAFGLLVILFVVFAGCLAVSAQDENSSAPVVWERYKINGTKISIMLPKLPIALQRLDACHQFIKNSYFAYAEGSVYELTVVENAWIEIPKDCSVKVPYGPNTFADRLSELRNDKEKSVETSELKGENQVYKFAAESATRWVFADLKNKRWIELAVASRPGSKLEEDRFVSSLSLDSKEGKQVGLGSERTLGDADFKPTPLTYPPKMALSEPVRIIISPHPSYTEEARKKNIQGTVRLKVVLLANGGIGSIEITKSLPGLDDQAIAAARKTVFIPKRVNSVPINVTKILEYGFSIY